FFDKLIGWTILSALSGRLLRIYRTKVPHWWTKPIAVLIKQGSTIANWQRAYDSQGFEGLTGAPGRPKNKGDRAMTHQDKQPRNLSQSELEELIELREKTMYLEAENAYLKKLKALIQKQSNTKKKQK